MQLVPHLVARLRGEAERDGAVRCLTHLLLHDRTRPPWNEHIFWHVFAGVRAAAVAGIPADGDQPATEPMPSCADLRFMELRHTAVTRPHETELDDLGISVITGYGARDVRQALSGAHDEGSGRDVQEAPGSGKLVQLVMTWTSNFSSRAVSPKPRKELVGAQGLEPWTR